MYLLSSYISKGVEYVKLTSSPPEYYKKGKDFCLSCYYQELGFEPEPNDDERYKRLDYLIKECIKRKIIKNENLLSMCLLCKCQEKIISKNIDLDGLAINDIQVDMVSLVPNLKKQLRNAIDEIDKNC